jgi:hypothetical protein
MSNEDINDMAEMCESAEPVEAPANLQIITKQAAELKDEITKQEADVKRKKEKFAELANTILRTLDLMSIDSIRAHGFLFFKELKSSVTTPKTLEDKKQFFDFLESKGMFLEMVSINSQTLNSLYKSLADEAAEAGVLDFKLPGIPEPTTYTNLKLRRS